MHLDKGNKLDEVLRNKFESHSTEVDPKLWTGVLDEVERGDRTNGLLLTLGSLFIAMSLFFGYNHNPALDGSSGITEMPGEIHASLDFSESPSHLPSEQKAPSGIIIPQDSNENSSKKEELSTAEVLRPVQTTSKKGSDLIVSTSREKGYGGPAEEAEGSSIGGAHSLPSRDNYETGEPTASYTNSDIGGSISLLNPRDLTSIGVSAQVDERVLRQSGGIGLESMSSPSILGRWGVEVLVGPSFNYRTFEAPESQAFTDHKNASDSRLVSANTEILIHYQPAEQWIFSLGIGRMNTGENYAYTLHEQTHEFKNEYHYLTIPVRAKYRIWEISPGLGLYAGAGAQLGFLQEGTSSWVDIATEQAVTHNNKGDESPFRDKVISGEVDLMIRLALSERIFISAQERGTYAINSVYKDETGLEQHQFSFDTLFGIGLRF